MKKRLKVAAFATLVCFLTTQSVWGAPMAGIEMTGQRELPAYLSIDIPAELGTVDALYEAPAGANPQFILHIQNAHANYQAQMKIKQLLQHMNKKYGFTTIFVEGASEKLDADYLRLFPDQERNMKLCDELAKQGELTGAELFLMEQTGERGTGSGERGAKSEKRSVRRSALPEPRAEDRQVEALGIEDASLYRSNYEALKKVFGAETDVTRFFKGFDGKLDKVASSTFTPETRELIADWKRFEQGRRDFMPFVRSLSVKSKKILKVDLESLFAQVGWPQISRLLVIQQMEKEMNKAKGVEEQAALIKMLRTKGVSKELLATLENFNEGSIAVGKATTEVSPREVLERLAAEAGSKGFKFSDYPAFSLFAGYVTLRSELDPKVLFEEIEYLFTQMLDILAKEPQQKALLALYRDGELLRKLLHLELNRTQWHEVVNAGSRMTVPSLVARLKECVQNGEWGTGNDGQNVQRYPSDVTRGEAAVMPPKFAKTMDELFTAGLEFYDYAHKREAVFYKEMQTAMTERKITKAILITGGFHTDGMSDLFRDNAVSYGIVTPRLSEKSNENLYRSLMLHKNVGTFDISYLDAVITMEPLKAKILQGGFSEGAASVTKVMKIFMKSAGLEKSGLDVAVKAFKQTQSGKSFLGDSFDIVKEGKQYKLVARAEARDAGQLPKIPVNASPALIGSPLENVKNAVRVVVASNPNLLEDFNGIAKTFEHPEDVNQWVKDSVSELDAAGLLKEVENAISQGLRFEARDAGQLPKIPVNASPALILGDAAKIDRIALQLDSPSLLFPKLTHDFRVLAAKSFDDAVRWLDENLKLSVTDLRTKLVDEKANSSKFRMISLVTAPFTILSVAAAVLFLANMNPLFLAAATLAILFSGGSIYSGIKWLGAQDVLSHSQIQLTRVEELIAILARNYPDQVMARPVANALPAAAIVQAEAAPRAEARKEEAPRGVPEIIFFQGAKPILTEELMTAQPVGGIEGLGTLDAPKEYLPRAGLELFWVTSKLLQGLFSSERDRGLIRMVLAEILGNASYYSIPSGKVYGVKIGGEILEAGTGKTFARIQFTQSNPDPEGLKLLKKRVGHALENFEDFDYPGRMGLSRPGGGGLFRYLAYASKAGIPVRLDFSLEDSPEKGIGKIMKTTLTFEITNQAVGLERAEARVMGVPELRAEAKRLSAVKALTDNRVSVYVGEVNKVAALVISMPDKLGEFAITDLIKPIEIENGHYVIQHLVNGKPETNKDIPLVLPFPINEQMPLNAFTDRLAVSKVFSPDSLNTLKNTTSQMLHDLGLAEEKLMAQPVEVQVAVALTWGIAATGNLEKVAPLLLAIANLVDGETLTGLRNALQKAVPGIKIPFSSERGNSVRVMSAADLARDPVASLKLLKFNYTLNPEVTPHIIAMGEATKEHSKAAKWVADQFNQWGSMKKGAQRFEKMKIEVVNPKSAKASDAVNNFLTQVQVNGSCVVSGDARELQGLPDVILSNLSAKAPVIFETGVNSAVDQPMVMTAVARAAQLIGASKGQSAGDLTNMLIKDQLPDYGYRYTNGRLEINSASIDALRSLQTLFAAFQTIAAAA